MGQAVPIELIGGPCDGNTLCLDWLPREILLPTYDDPLAWPEINPDIYRPVRYSVAVYRKVVDKNQYRFSGMRSH